jgi:hypothetical protein
MTVAQLDNFFAPAVEQVIRLRDACRAAVLHHARCVEEVKMLEADQMVNLSEPDRRGPLIRQVGQSLTRTRARRDQARAEAQRLQDQLTEAARACPNLLNGKVEISQLSPAPPG